MDDSIKTVIKLGAVAVGAFLLYEWLKSQGYWDQWFGGNSFSDPQKLLDYCAQNPAGTATFTGSGQAVSASCRAWLAAQRTPVPVTAPPAAPVGTPPDQSLIDAMLKAGQTTKEQLWNVWQWNFVYNVVKPNSANLDTADNSQTMTVAQYLQARQTGGLAGGRFLSAYQAPRFVN